jgi:hypothetical protein
MIIDVNIIFVENNAYTQYILLYFCKSNLVFNISSNDR